MGHEFDSPFEVLEKAFALLVAGPEPLSLDGRLVRGLPSRPIPLDELRGRLLHPSISYHTRDVALVLLLRRAKREGGAWTVGLCGVVLPGLRRAAVPLAKALPGSVLDLEAEMLAALVETIRTVPARADRLAAGLVWPAVRAGHRFVVQERRRREWEAPHASLEPPLRVPQHPDLVLEAAVAAGVIAAQEAELVGGEPDRRDAAAPAGAPLGGALRRPAQAPYARRAGPGRVAAHQAPGHHCDCRNRPSGAASRRAATNGSGRHTAAAQRRHWATGPLTRPERHAAVNPRTPQDGGR
jgi:hypothetical protein